MEAFLFLHVRTLLVVPLFVYKNAGLFYHKNSGPLCRDSLVLIFFEILGVNTIFWDLPARQIGQAYGICQILAYISWIVDRGFLLVFIRNCQHIDIHLIYI